MVPRGSKETNSPSSNFPNEATREYSNKLQIEAMGTKGVRRAHLDPETWSRSAALATEPALTRLQ